MHVVVGSSYLWRDSAKVGLHALAEHLLVRGCRLEWFTIPLSLLHFVKPTSLSLKLRLLTIALGKALREGYGDGVLTNRVPLTPLHPIAGIPILSSYLVSSSYLRWAIPSLLSVLKKDGVYPVDVLLFDSGGLNIYYPLSRASTLTVYRLSDLVAEFPGQVRGRIASEKEILKEADIVLPVSNSLYEEAVRIRGTSRGVYLLPNGVDFELFSRTAPEPPEYSRIPRPRAVFVGALSSWFDWDLLREIAARRADVSFVVVGRGTVPVELPSNVYMLGSRPYMRIPAYMQHADVGLVLFKDVPLIHRMEKPLKFYEYLAAGLPVVSVPYGQLRRMEPYAVFGATPDEFVVALDTAMGTGSEERVQRRKEAENHSWKNVFTQFDTILEEHGVSLP